MSGIMHNFMCMLVMSDVREFSSNLYTHILGRPRLRPFILVISCRPNRGEKGISAHFSKHGPIYVIKGATVLKIS
jgi:hypothetical protein